MRGQNTDGLLRVCWIILYNQEYYDQSNPSMVTPVNSDFMELPVALQ